MLLRTSYAISGTEIGYAATRARWPQMQVAPYAICLRACYAMSGTETVYLPTRVFAASGTELAYAAMRC
eukprot:2225807-Rhodomonas_salina.1